MQVGSEIIVNGSGRGSVGCFARKNDNEDDRLYFTLARHVATHKVEISSILARVYDSGRAVEGKVRRETSPLLDTCLADIEEGTIGPDDYKIPGINRLFSRVWSPHDILNRIKEAKTSSDQEIIKKECVKVCHMGKTAIGKAGSNLVAFDGQLQIGSLRPESRRLKMVGRTTYAGDSGGPVFTEDMALVGFVSLAGSQGESQDTDIVLAYYIFEELKCTLADPNVS